MAIKVLMSDALLSTSNGQYNQVDAYNLALTNISSPSYWINFNTALRTLNVTFANAGNQTGIFLFVRQCYTGTLTIKLLEGSTERTSNVFNFATNPITTSTQGSAPSWYFFPLTSYAVTTAASTWSYTLSCTSSIPSGQVTTSLGTDYLYMAVTDSSTTKVSLTADTLVIKNGVTLRVDESINHREALGTLSSGLILGDGATYRVNNADLSGPITIDFEDDQSRIFPSYNSNFLIGSSAAPISAANRVTIDYSALTTYLTHGAASTLYFSTYTTMGFEFYGATDDYMATTVSAEAAAGQAHIITSEDMSGQWSVGDALMIIGKAKTITTADFTNYTISSISGTDITLNTNLDYAVMAGAGVVNGNRKELLGIQLFGSTTNSFLLGGMRIGYIHLSGVHLKIAAICGATVVNLTYATANRLLINKVMYTEENVTPLACLYFSTVNNAVVNELYHFSTSTAYRSFVLMTVIGNNMTINKVYQKNAYSSTTSLTLSTAVAICANGNGNTISNIISQNGRTGNYSILGFFGAGLTISNVLLCGPCDNALNINLVNSTFTNVKINTVGTHCVYSNSSVGVIFKEGNFGDYIVPTTALVDNLTDSLCQTLFISPTVGALPALADNLANSVPGSYVRIQDYNGTTNDVRGAETYGYTNSSGSGLTDTTVRTAGGYPIRLESNNSTEKLEWTQTIPTGNIQNKSMLVGVWCKINNAAYYSATHQLPRLTINYDNGSIIYCQASETTDWQFLAVPFTPTTTYAQITATVSTMTDQTGSSAYVYFADYSVLLPAGVQLNLGSLSLWANGQPILPTISTNLSANDVWTAVDTADYGANTMGNRVKKLKNPSILIDGETIN